MYNLTCEINPTVVILNSLNFKYRLSFGGWDMNKSIHDLPLVLIYSVFLEEDGDHCYVLFICIIGVIDARCEDSRLPLLKMVGCLGTAF